MPKEEGDEGEEAAVEEEGPKTAGFVPDLLADQKIWQWAGISFGETDTLLLQKSIKELSVKTGASSMRLWGKILGSNADYFIVEAVQEGGEGEGEGEGDGEAVEAAEPRGSGVNQFVYWVTNSPLKSWSQLPDIKASQINNARKIKHNFTGDINSKIYTNPFFVETEKIYLRA